MLNWVKFSKTLTEILKPYGEPNIIVEYIALHQIFLRNILLYTKYSCEIYCSTPNILAKYIALQLESRIAFRKTMKKVLIDPLSQ